MSSTAQKLAFFMVGSSRVSLHLMMSHLKILSKMAFTGAWTLAAGIGFDGEEAGAALNGAGPLRSAGFLWVFISSVTFFRPSIWVYLFYCDRFSWTTCNCGDYFSNGNSIPSTKQDLLLQTEYMGLPFLL